MTRARIVGSVIGVLILAAPAIASAFSFSDFLQESGDYMWNWLGGIGSWSVDSFQDWNLVSTVAAGGHMGDLAVFTSSMGEYLMIDVCSNGNYGMARQTICYSAPNSCGMKGVGVVYHYQNGEGALHDVPCNAVTPPDTQCSGTSATCSSPSVWNGVACVVPNTAQACTGGSHWNGSACICPLGNVFFGGRCVDLTSSSFNEFFQERAPYNPNFYNGFGSSTPLVVDTDIKVVPSLVRPGNAVHVSWSATHVASCVVSAPNGDTWNTIVSLVGGNPSSPIVQQTTYTLTCIDTHGASVQKTATVNILPNWQEQ